MLVTIKQKKYIHKIKLLCWPLIHFMHLINVRNMEHIIQIYSVVALHRGQFHHD